MSSVTQKQVGIAAAAVTLVTTAETLIAYSGRVEIQYQTIRSVIRGWANVTWGTGTTSAILRFRRGNGLTGTIVATTGNVNVTAAQTTAIDLQFAEQIINGEFNDYSLTIQQNAATANGTVNLAQIECEMING